MILLCCFPFALHCSADFVSPILFSSHKSKPPLNVVLPEFVSVVDLSINNLPSLRLELNTNTFTLLPLVVFLSDSLVYILINEQSHLTLPSSFVPKL